MLRNVLAATMAAAFMCAPAFAETEVGGRISTNTTWSSRDMPFIVTSDVIVDRGVVLTIEPGVAVGFDVYATLTVEGVLDARGTVTDSILFERTVRNETGWGGIRIASGDPSIIRYARITGGDANVEGNTVGGALFVNHAEADLTLDRCVIHGNHADELGGAIGVSDGSLTMTHCVLYENVCEGKGGAIASLGGTLRVTNCTFFGNRSVREFGGAIALDRGTLAPTTTLLNTILWGNAPDEILPYEGTHSAAYCDIASERLPEGFTDLGGNIFVDPRFVDDRIPDLRLRETSPCIDAGDRDSPPDPDGTTADIGALFYDQTPFQYLTLPGKVLSETSPAFFLNVTGTLIDARSVNFAFLCNPSVATFDTLFATAFDSLSDANVQVNVSGDTVFVAMAASEQKSVSDSIIARMGFVTRLPGATPLIWLPEFVDIDEELPALTNGGIQISAYYGDVSLDGSVTAFDAAAILRYVVHVIFNLNLDRADVTGNGKITAYDAALVLYSIVNPGYYFPVRGGALVKRGVGGTPKLAWIRTGDAWSLVADAHDGPLSAELTLRLPDGAGIASDGIIATNRAGDVVAIAVARADGGSELLRIDGLGAAPEVLSATVNDRNAVVSQPAAFALHQNAPNPFNPSTTIAFSLPEAGRATLGVYSATGQLVRTIVDFDMVAGTHEIVWDGRDASGRNVASGVYVYRLHTPTNTAVRKLTLVR